MKGSIGLGLIIGIIAAIFLPYVFALINSATAFDALNGAFGVIGSGDTGAFLDIFSASFGTDELVTAFQTNLLLLFAADLVSGGPPAIDFMVVLPAILTWIVLGLLAGLFTQSPKKGVLSAIVFVVVEILIYMLMMVLDLKNLVDDVIFQGYPNDMMAFVILFLGRVVITPLGFGIVGGVIGGLISQFAFGPEEI